MARGEYDPDAMSLENTASAGDVILMHPLLLHAPPTAHLGSTPRLLLNKDILPVSAPLHRSEFACGDASSVTPR